MTMDPIMRGVFEKYIDEMLEGDEIQKVKELIYLMDLPAASHEDAALGVFLGIVYAHAKEHFLRMYNRLPEESELDEYRLILQRRAPEFKIQFLLEPQIEETEDDGVHINESEETEELEREPEATDIKFSFDSKSRRAPVTTILGIPIRE
jgi:hypothetical protein